MTTYALPVGADPVGLSDIAERLGVHRQTTKQWNTRGELPPPKWHASGRPLWDWPDIVKWAAKTGRSVPPQP